MMRVGQAAVNSAVVTALTALFVGASILPAAAHPESEAPTLRPDVVRVGHEPDTPAGHAQFVVFLEPASNASFEQVAVQICLISQIVCIIPPRPAEFDGARWHYDTADFRAAGADRPYRWPPNERIGVQWFLGPRNASLEELEPFPHGTDLGEPQCKGSREATVQCYETHYFEFRNGPANKGSPNLGLLSMLTVVAGAGVARAGFPGPARPAARRGGGPRPGCGPGRGPDDPLAKP
jgi:hypothetical protein